jgi:thiol-disulfide isomerase/thioredoxin
MRGNRRIPGRTNVGAAVRYVGLIALILTGIIAGTPGQAKAQATGLEVDSLVVGDQAPTFVMKQMGELGYVFLRDYAGDLRQTAVLDGKTPKIVVLSFFASWCKPCAEEMPELALIAKEYEQREVRVFFVDLNEEESVVAAWLLEHPEIEGTVLMDPYAQNAIKYGVDALPRTIVIGRDGVVKFIERGFNTEGYHRRVTAALEQLLGG